MTKIIVLLAVLASTGCAEATGEVALIGGGAGHAGGGDTYSAPERTAIREVPQRELVQRGHVSHHDGEFVVCAQCRH